VTHGQDAHATLKAGLYDVGCTIMMTDRDMIATCRPPSYLNLHTIIANRCSSCKLFLTGPGTTFRHGKEMVAAADQMSGNSLTQWINAKRQSMMSMYEYIGALTTS